MSPAALLLALAACKGGDEVAETAAWDRIGVDDFTPEGGPSATIWVQGNADFVEGAEACADDVCETTDAEGIARLLDLPEGEVAIRVDGGDGVPLLLGLTLRNDFVPHLAARSLTPGIYRSWLGAGVWTWHLHDPTTRAPARGRCGCRACPRARSSWPSPSTRASARHGPWAGPPTRRATRRPCACGCPSRRTGPRPCMCTAWRSTRAAEPGGPVSPRAPCTPTRHTQPHRNRRNRPARGRNRGAIG